MKLTVISWNIRHLRYEKVRDYKKDVTAGLEDAHIAFLYENKRGNEDNGEMYDGLMEIMGDVHKDSKGVEIGIMSVSVGTNEYVQVLYCEKRPTGDRSRHGKDKEIQIDVYKETQYNDDLWSAGWEALKKSLNETVMSERSVGRLAEGVGYRIPAVVKVTITKPDFSTRSFTIAAWHAPGPAKGTPGILFEAYMKVLATKIDLFVGDFNYNPSSRFAPPRTVEDVITWYRIRQSTTINDEGNRTRHSAGPDLVYYNTDRLTSSGLNVTSDRALIGNIEIRESDITLAKKLFELSDHLPVVVTIKKL